MTDVPNRHTDTGRNKILIGAVRKLDEIINRHDPEIDVTVNAGVWNALDQLCHSLETAAERRGYARGIDDCVARLSDRVSGIGPAIRALSPSAPAPAAVPETPTSAQWHSMCLSLRHDYGLMDREDQEALKLQVWECWKAISRALAEQEKQDD